MQLKKQAIRKSPTFDQVSHPRGIRRSPNDFNQRRNAEQVNRNARGDSFE